MVQVWSVIPVLRRERWEDQEFKASFSYTASSKLQEAYLNQAWWRTPVISALMRLRQEDLEFQASLGYIAIPGQPGLHSKTR